MPDCEEELWAIRCTLPEGHDGSHMSDDILPPGLGPFIDEAWRAMDRARERHDRSRRIGYVLNLVWLALAIWYIILIVQQIGAPS